MHDSKCEDIGWTLYRVDDDDNDLFGYIWNTSPVFHLINRHDQTPNRPKEHAVVQHLLTPTIKKNFHIPLNRAIAGSSSRYRPDMLAYCGTHAVIVEIDEHQHHGYSKFAEESRMSQLHEDLKLPVHIIRFNTDSYKKDGVKTPSPWQFGRILPSRSLDWSSRLKTLTKVFHECLLNPPTTGINVIYLYYSSIESVG